MSHYAGRAMRQVRSVAGRLFPLSIALLVVSVFAPRVVEAQSLPSGWSASNVGSPAIAGSVTYSNSTFTVRGAGTQVYGTSDQFYYVYRRLTGNATIVARVGSIENTSSWAKAGVMIRESLAATSRHAFALVTPGQGIAFHRRTSAGGSTSHTGRSGVAPVWLRLVRSGSTITASRSTNGTSWSTIGSASISMSSTVYVGLAVSSYNAGRRATATFSSASVSVPTVGGLPAGWSGTDVGNPSADGNVRYSSGTFTVWGGGTDIWGTRDQFGFVYRQVSGDVDIVARVASFDGPDEWSKAGVMIRSSLSASSAHAFMLVSIAKGLAFQRRPANGLSSLHTSAGSGRAPAWVKLERRGSAVTAFRSSNGSSWTMVGSETLTLPSTFYVGLAVTSHYPSRTATAAFTNVTVQSPSSSPSPTPPAVSLTSPASGATFTAPATVSIAANATGSDDGVARVEFYANGTLLGTDSSSPYTFTWSGVPAGGYTLTAAARDTRGAVATSSPRSITVNTGGGGSNRPPTVSLSAPASGATYLAPASVTIAANAADADGSVARVDFYAGSTLVGSDTTNPYSVTWSSVPAGSYSLTAVARDNAGATTRSAARTITVNGGAILTRAVFGPSPDHSSVTYRLHIFTAGVNPATATPMAAQNLGRPAVVNGECTVDIAATISGLPGGSYFATVLAVGSSGSSSRTTSAVFSR
ncbi:MAG: Ig-like domain-containing protein [Vicinamibacterales bacterium]